MSDEDEPATPPNGRERSSISGETEESNSTNLVREDDFDDSSLTTQDPDQPDEEIGVESLLETPIFETEKALAEPPSSVGQDESIPEAESAELCSELSSEILPSRKNSFQPSGVRVQCGKVPPWCPGTPPVDNALVLVHNQLVNLESRFQKDLHSLEARYFEELYGPLLTLRNRLLEASKAFNTYESCERKTRTKPCYFREWDDCEHEAAMSRRRISDIGLTECDLFDSCSSVIAAEEFGEDTWCALKHMLCRISDALQLRSRHSDCVIQPHKFWYHVFKRSAPILSAMVGRNDAEFLGCIRDVRVRLYNANWPDTCQFRTGVKRRHPPFIKKCGRPRGPARYLSSCGLDFLPQDDCFDPAFLSVSESTSDVAMNCVMDEPADCDAEDSPVVGFELEFELYPNTIVQNSILRKRYLIDVGPQKEDFTKVKKHKDFKGPTCDMSKKGGSRHQRRSGRREQRQRRVSSNEKT